MAKTKSEMFTLIGADFPDNDSGLITPEKLREVTTQLADSMLYAASGVREVDLIRSASTATQAPSAVDTPLQVVFGAAQGSSSTPVMLNASGLITFNTAGTYAVRVKLQQGRAGASGTSILLSRLLINGAQFGSTQCSKLITSDLTAPSDSRVVVSVAAGSTLAVQIMRDSSGTNFGGLYPQSAVVTSWGVCPSALIVVSRLEPV